jgi:hypothetical protein
MHSTVTENCYPLSYTLQYFEISKQLFKHEPIPLTIDDHLLYPHHWLQLKTRQLYDYR